MHTRSIARAHIQVLVLACHSSRANYDFRVWLPRMLNECRRIPPREGWIKAPMGTVPVPNLRFENSTTERVSALETYLEEKLFKDIEELESILKNRKRRVAVELEELAAIAKNHRKRRVKETSNYLRDRKRSLQAAIDRMTPAERRAQLQQALDRVTPSSLAEGGEETRMPKCIICQDSDAIRVILPCGHLCLCDGGCADALTASSIANASACVCPMCRRNVDGTMKIFTA